LPTGASCAPCASLYSGEPLAVALTDAHGAFTLSGVPDGDNIPLVIQVGKWRRQLVLPRVLPCQDNAVPDKTARLPRNHMEGDLPSIAMSTGNADSLECMLTRVGIDPSEFVGGAGGSGRVHVFAGGGTFAPNTSPAGPLSATALWSSAQSLMPYDLVVLSCEGAETTNMNQAALHDYATAGGRVLASHFHYAWFNTGPYGAENLAQWTIGSNDIGNVSASVVGTFPKGAAYATWLGAVGALTNNLLPIQQARHNADVGPGNTHSQAWLSTPMPMATELFTFNTPTNAPTACGRVTWTGIHVGGASNDYVGGTSLVPTGCTAGKLSVQERALEFALFDLSACISPDSVAPTAPIQP
jgi:hypothetical protein